MYNNNDGANTSRRKSPYFFYFKEAFLSFLSEAGCAEVTGPALPLQPNGLQTFKMMPEPR